ncbi:MAG: hypothetical protein LBQ66_15050 [Planctomycetaceae bacterium]|nr:hypothetical protein [Planctomycetaceae bacterium]
MANVLQPVLAFSSNLFGSITHRGGRDARVPVLRRFAANLCGITMGMNTQKKFITDCSE